MHRMLDAPWQDFTGRSIHKDKKVQAKKPLRKAERNPKGGQA